ncbi:MAG: nuclear transport factor 2 family protein [Gemmatimonadales bacterium]|nr:nuclear transport factor 2 family protein [Gemmatimonadales bacterium]
MSARRTMVSFAALASLAVVSPVRAQTVEETAARIPLEAYIKAHSTGDADVMATAFHPSARMVFVTDTGLAIVPISDYIARIRSGTKRAPDGRPRTIAMLEIKGTAAIARIDMDLGPTTLNDYMTLVKLADGWKIVNKSFYRATAP